MTYREKEYFAVLRTRENMKSSPFMLFLLKGSSKERLEQELSDAGFVPFQNKLMTRQQLMKQDKAFYNRVGIINPEFEADAATAIVKFNQEKTAEAFTEVHSLFDKAKNLGYCEENNIYVRLQNAIVTA